ncbi:DUF1853 family protein [Trinickia mobilis]|uniref:DUF1853 family protein n=1 Tax=Trinickia mobilis TaxID=2816356 RepID=UPI001A8CC9AD|nr:DUF1853 family protein [Trinickia mobilis]
MKTLEPAANAAAALDALLDSLVDSAVRDLAWLIFSPDLLRAQPPAGMLASPFESAGEASATVAWLLALDQDAHDLHQSLVDAHVTRLGRYAECLLGYFLRHGPAARLVAANVALRRAGRTLGECDFLVETASGKRLHWELAVKCYLHAGGARASMADYVGPNLQDRFDLKFTHLLDHQLPLSAREEFASLGHGGPWDAQMFVKGWLFYRWSNAPDAAVQVPAEVHPAHARGWWLARSDLPRFASGHADAWAVLPRLAWLAPRHRAPVDDGAGVAARLLGSDALAEQLAQQSGPAMVAAFARDGGEYWFERSRGFVVPNDWPERALTFAQQ